MSNRRLNGEGTIVWHKNAKQYMVVVMDNGIRTTVYAKTILEAKKKLREMQRRQEDGVRLVQSSMPLKKYLPEWLQLIKPTLRTKSYESYEGLLRVHLVPRLGHIKLNKLTPEHINGAWAKMLKAGHSPAIIGHCHARLSKALHDATRRNLIANNPMQFVAKPKIETKEIRPLSSEKDDTGSSEIDRVLEVAKDTEYLPIIHTALHTGMRRNELLGLRWKDINLDEAILHLSRSIHRSGQVTTYHSPKTKSGSRPIDLTPSSALFLRKQWELQKGDGLIYNYKVTKESPVFIRRTGEPLLPETVTHAFKKLVTSIGIADVWFHDLRHTHATVMLLQGVHPKVVQERLGHSKMSTTMDLYSHVMPSMQKDAVERFEMALETRV